MIGRMIVDWIPLLVYQCFLHAFNYGVWCFGWVYGCNILKVE